MKRLCVLLAILLCLCACGQTAEPPATAARPTDCPASYRDAPEAYWPFLDSMYRFVQAARRIAEEEEAPSERLVDWGEWPSLEELPLGPLFNGGECFLGYAVEDINRDGVPELFVLTQGDWTDPDEPGMWPHIWMLFTLQDHRPVYLTTIEWRTVGKLAGDGTLYISGNRDAVYMKSLLSYRLEPGAAELTLLAEYYNEITLGVGEAWYEGPYEGGGPVIPREEIEALRELFWNPPNPMKLSFIPIEQ